MGLMRPSRPTVHAKDRRDSGAIAQGEQSATLPECRLIVLVKLKLNLYEDAITASLTADYAVTCTLIAMFFPFSSR